MDIGTYVVIKTAFMDVNQAILIIYNYRTVKVRASYQFTDRSTPQPADNPSNSDRLRDVHQTVPKVTAQVY